MTIRFPAVFENGVFRPLRDVPVREGQEVSLAAEISELDAASPTEPLSAAPPSLPDWCRVYEGLSDAEVREVESIAFDRSRFIRSPDGRD